MSCSDTDPDPSPDSPDTTTTALDEWPVFEMDYALESSDRGERCTLYPRGVGDELGGQWISADVGSFVSVESAR